MRLSQKFIALCFLTFFTFQIKGQTIVKSALSVGYTYFPKDYFVPSNNRLENYKYPDFDSRYVLTSSTTPNVGLDFDIIPVRKKWSINIGVNYYFNKINYDIEDKAFSFFYPFGNIELTNNAFEFTGNFLWMINDDMFQKTYHKIGTGLLYRHYSYNPNVIQDALDDILDRFPLSSDNMNNNLAGLRMLYQFGIRYHGSSMDSQYLRLEPFAEINFNGLFKDQSFVPAFGASFGIELN